MRPEKETGENIAGRCTAIVLAGGKSARMGRDKALLDWNGRTLLEHQIEKLRSMGIREILVSGHDCARADVTAVPDTYPGCGPLAGIQSCLKVSCSRTCLVLSVDVPLISADTLMALLRHHEAGNALVTVLSVGENIEPLIGVYDASVAPAAEKILESGGRSVRRLFDAVGIACCPFTGPMSELSNCNTPAEFASARASGLL